VWTALVLSVNAINQLKKSQNTFMSSAVRYLFPEWYFNVSCFLFVAKTSTALEFDLFECKMTCYTHFGMS